MFSTEWLRRTLSNYWISFSLSNEIWKLNCKVSFESNLKLWTPLPWAKLNALVSHINWFLRYLDFEMNIGLIKKNNESEASFCQYFLNIPFKTSVDNILSNYSWIILLAYAKQFSEFFPSLRMKILLKNGRFLITPKFSFHTPITVMFTFMDQYNRLCCQMTPFF